MADKFEKVIELTKEEFNFYKNFLQYGNLSNAKVVFVGREEGLGQQDIEENYKGRKKWFEKIPENIKYIDGNDPMKGYYIDDGMLADWVRTRSEKEFDKFVMEDSVDSPVLLFASKIMVLLSEGFDIKDNELKESANSYKRDKLYRKDNETAMIDYYTLPKQGETKFICKEIDDKQAEEERKEIIKNVYSTFNIPVSIVYAGMENKKFRLREFYEELGFVFEEKDTSMVHNKYMDIVKPAKNPKEFLIGKKNDSNQYCIMTTFFGVGNIGNDDIRVISTWVKDLMSKINE